MSTFTTIGKAAVVNAIATLAPSQVRKLCTIAAVESAMSAKLATVTDPDTGKAQTVVMLTATEYATPATIASWARLLRDGSTAEEITTARRGRRHVEVDVGFAVDF